MWWPGDMQSSFVQRSLFSTACMMNGNLGIDSFLWLKACCLVFLLCFSRLADVCHQFQLEPARTGKEKIIPKNKFLKKKEKKREKSLECGRKRWSWVWCI
jgi:hypothetical protein